MIPKRLKLAAKCVFNMLVDARPAFHVAIFPLFIGQGIGCAGSNIALDRVHIHTTTRAIPMACHH
jgi:hypothetical protein